MAATYHPSPRHVAILSLMADGKNNRDIGSSLYLSENTVKTYVKQVMESTGIHDRAGLVAWALRGGVIA